MNRIWFLVLTVICFFGVGIIYSCSQEPRENRSSQDRTTGSGATFVGDKQCQSCHAKEAHAWEGSDHQLAMAKATEASVLGDFSDMAFTQQGETYRFFRKGKKFMVRARGPHGKQRDYQISYTFGWSPLQQYLVDFGGGKLQALSVAWDTQKKRWFSLYPDQKIRSGEWLHWTGGAMNWNTMCADCHSTNVHQNYDAQADSFHTTWSSINVSCEACHGPGSTHAEFMKSEEGKQASIKRIRQDLKMTGATSPKSLVNSCARCHSRREKLTDHYDHNEKFMDQFDPALPHPPEYFADGQVKDEDYTYSSFIQSKMFNHGVQCIDCHKPHSLKMKANIQDNSLCLQCHADSYNSPQHHFHQPNTKASMCVNCHMPGRYYMQVDFRRDHSLRIPRPDLSVKYDIPNACNNCHTDKSAQWAADAVTKRYGPDRPHHFSEALLKASEEGPNGIKALSHLVGDTAQPAIARATALWYLGQYPDPAGAHILRSALKADNPLLRNSAAKAVASFPDNLKQPMLADALDDPVRAVRLSAVNGVAELSPTGFAPAYRQAYKDELTEYQKKLDVNRYFPQGEMNRGQFYEKRNQIDKAVQAYRKALKKDPGFNPARINLAYLMNSRGNNAEAQELFETVIKQEPEYGPAYYSMALLLSEEKKVKEAIPYFQKAARFMPENDRVHYNWAIALQNLNRPGQAEQAYLEAIRISPQNPDYRYGICTLYIQEDEYGKALPQARELTRLQPDNPRFQQLLQLIRSRNSD